MKYFVFIPVLILLVFSNYVSVEISEDFTEGEIKWSQLNYKITNGTATAAITVNDADMNKISSHIDTLFVHVSSDTYPEGIVLELYETEKNSGKFERTFTLSEHRFAPSILYMHEGDTATAKYIDDTLPPSYSSNELELIATTMMGSRGPPLERVPAYSFQIQDIAGNNILNMVPLGQQISLRSDLVNQYNRTQDFAYFVQIQDEYDRVVSLSWIQGTLMPFQKLSPSQSWIPTKSGAYSAVAFVWESLKNPSALSPPLTLDFDVSKEIILDNFSNHPKPVSEIIFSACDRDDDCTVRLLQQYSRNANSEQMSQTIDELLTLYVDADFYCHPIAHHVGEFLYGYLKRNLDAASAFVDSRCASGVLHGLVENTIVIENILHDTPIDKVDYVIPCVDIGNKLGKYAQLQCVHGMGHSIIKVYDYDTVEAVKKCNEYHDESDRFMCRGGLFMQNMKKYSDEKGGDFDESDMYYPCNKHADSDADLCYRYSSQYFLINNDYNATETFEMCDGIEKSEFIGWCYKGAGSHLAVEYFYDIDKTSKLCDLGNNQYKEWCVKGAIESITLYVDEDYGPLYCDNLDSEYRQDCMTRMEQILETKILEKER